MLDRVRARGLAHAPAGRLVLQQADDSSGERPLVPSREGDAGLPRHDLTVTIDVGRDDWRCAGEGSGEHHAEAFPTEGGSNKRFRPQQLRREVLLGEKAEDIDALVGDALAREEQAHGEWICADDTQPGTGAPADLGPGAQEHLQSFSRLLPSDEEDLVIPAVRIRVRRNENAVREDFVFAGQPAVRGVTRVQRDRDPVVEPVDEEAPDRHGGSHPAKVAVRVERSDERNLRQGHGRNRDRRRHRLVDVKHVEALAFERTRHASDGSR